MRRVGIALAALAAAASSLACAAASHAHPRQASTRLNVVVILSDDQRLDGNTVMHNVQRLLMRHGVTFSHYYVTTSMCGPSRASILTGLYSQHTGMLTNFDRSGYAKFPARHDLPVWLHRAGYETGLVGKYLNEYPFVGHNAVPPGWDNWQVMTSRPEEQYYNYDVNENGKIVHYGHAASDYSTTVLTKKANDFIRGARNPFFLYFAPIAPHLPAIPAPGDMNKLENLAPLHDPAYNEKNLGDKPWSFWHKNLLSAAAQLYGQHVRKRQLQSQLSLDRSVASIVATLRETHQLDHTVIIYTSDNGFLWGEHRLGGKIWPYEESVRVPLVVRTPWTQGNGTTNRSIVANIDLAPTIAKLAGIAPRAPVDGRNLSPLLHGVTVPWRKSILLEYLGKSRRREGGPPPYLAVHTKRYLWVEYTNGWRELYDLRKDPWELNNIAGQPRTLALRGQLHTLLRHLAHRRPHRVPRR